MMPTAIGVEMRKWILLFCLAAVFCGCASNDYQPGVPGVRDLPQADYYVRGYGMVYNSDGSQNR